MGGFDCQLHQDLCFGPGNYGHGRNLEVEAEELLVADDVRGRFVNEASAHQVSKALLLLLRQFGGKEPV